MRPTKLLRAFKCPPKECGLSPVGGEDPRTVLSLAGVEVWRYLIPFAVWKAQNGQWGRVWKCSLRLGALRQLRQLFLLRDEVEATRKGG